MEFKIGKAKVVILQGDISEQDVEAIGFSTNDRLWMGGRVGEILKQKAGEDIETEAMKQGPLTIGDVAVTGGGELPVKYIFHAVIMGQDLKPDQETVRAGTKNLIKKADEMKVSSLAVSAFGAGMGKLPAHESAKAMADEIINGLLEAENLKELRIVLHNEGIYNAFVSEFEGRFTRK